jgi:hypothetical protein
MSLESGGSTFNVEVKHPAIETVELYSYTRGCSSEDLKTAFMQAMQQFADSPEFAAVTHQLNNEIDIKVRHSIILRMPSSY